VLVGLQRGVTQVRVVTLRAVAVLNNFKK